MYCLPSTLYSLLSVSLLPSRYGRHGTKLALQKALFQRKVVPLTADAALVFGFPCRRFHPAVIGFLPTGFKKTMQILCKASEGDCDVSCPICGQGFQIYWTRSFSGERSTRVEIQQALLNQHGHNRELTGHPGTEFSVSVASLPGYFETLGAYA